MAAKIMTILHDDSEVSRLEDFYARKRDLEADAAAYSTRAAAKAMVLHSIWRPLLAGAAGAALVVGCVWVTLPKISYREIEIPRVTMRDVTVPNIILKDVEISRDVPMPGPQVSAKPPVPADLPKTPAEKKFTETPEYKNAIYRGRIVKSVDGRAVSFAEGKSFWPARWDSTIRAAVDDPDVALESDPYVGLLGSRHALTPQCPRQHLGDGPTEAGGPCKLKRALLAAALLAALAVPAFADSGILPDPTITPGAVRTTDVASICATDTRELRHWSRERDDRIMLEYGLEPGPHPDYEIDHLLPLSIGGADDDRNLWPEPRRSIEPIWNAERKDRLEYRLRELVCSGALDVREAQKAIADDCRTLRCMASTRRSPAAASRCWSTSPAFSPPATRLA